MKEMKFFMSALAAVAMAATLASCEENGDSTEDDPVEDITFESGATLSGRYNDNITLKEGNYNLTSSLQIQAPGTLTIEPGTTITAEANNNIIYILIEQGAQIIAEGTESKPIVMTSEEDRAGAWGGLHICGKARTNAGTGSSEIGNATYGGDVETDNSGILKYLIIENSGFALDEEHEANGISLYGVGSGTEISYVYVVNGNDDGIEFFGGSVNIDHCIVKDCTDDSYDWTEGWNGTAEYIVAYQTVDGCDCLMECDNNDGNNAITPNSCPTISHATFVGKDYSTTGEDAKDQTFGIKFRAGTWVNMEYAIVTGKTTAIRIETAHTVDSFAEDGESSISNTVITGSFVNKEGTGYDQDDFVAAGNKVETTLTLTDGYYGLVEGAGAIDSSNDWASWIK